jgi:hypothetical protein
MRTRSLIRILLFLAVGWIFILSPGLISQWAVLKNADGYRRAEFQVTGSHCIGGGSGGRTSNSSPSCFLTGKVLIDGKSISEEYSVGSTLPSDRPAGSQFAVFYNPRMPAFGMNYFNERVLAAESDGNPAQSAHRWLWAAARMILLSLAAAAAVHMVLRMSLRRLSRPPHGLAVDFGGGPAAAGTLLVSLGLSFLIGQIPDFTWGGILVGLILCVIGSPMLIRRFLVLSKDDGRATRGSHLLGFAFRTRSQPLPGITRIRVEGRARRSAILLVWPEGSELVREGEPYAANLKVASRLAGFFGVPLEQEPQSEASQKDPLKRDQHAWLVQLLGVMAPLTILFILVAMAVLSLGGMPSTRLSLATWVLEPSGTMRHAGLIRRWALDQLANDPSPAALLELLRLVNTVDAVSFPELAADLDAAAVRRSGLVPPAEQDRETHVRTINVWAASHLHRPLDGNGGILSWAPVSERFVDPINAIAGQNLNEAWLAWDHFAAGDLISPEQFLYAVGPALGDPRPVRFAITRNGATFEGQPVPIDSRPDVLAHTVGEALALQLWLKEGVGDRIFPEDFRAWWSQWARDHRLPPPR